MGRIQSSIGLITGVPIGDMVDQLMALAARPRDLLAARAMVLQQEQAAITKLSALLLSVKFVTDNLGKEGLYNQRTATSSNPDALAATVTGEPPMGTYRFTPLRTVQSQQLLSSGFKTDTESIGNGRLTFRFGDHVQRSAPLELFGGGSGIARGTIRISDRSGASAEIDLSMARTIDDVLDAINANHAINVTAVAHGDGIRLTDTTGQTASNLSVFEVGGGSTAASLGLAGIDVAADVADGQDMLWLFEDLDLDALGDGTGLRVDRVLEDIAYELRDGTTGVINLSPIISGGSEVDEETTLGEIMEVINAAAPGKLEVQIAPEGNRLMVSDLTEGDGTFALSSLNESAALADLGLDGEAVDGVILGSRILAGTKTVLLSSLGGGRGLGPLGSLQLTDRSGVSDVVDLSIAETLEDVVDAINAASVGITAQVNQARNGIELLDTTGVQTGNLVVANADATATADRLQIAIDANVASVNSGDLHLQVIAENTELSALGGGAGIALGTLTIRDSTGKQDQLDLRVGDVETVGDLIRAINRLDLDAAVYAEINETGDGIRIVDRSGGNGFLHIAEGNTTTAKDLNLLGDVKEVDIDGETARVIDGSMTYTVEIDGEEVRSLEDLRQAINDLDVGVTAMTFVDGSSKPFRLALMSNRPGKAGELVFDASQVDFSMQQTVRAQDALLAFGEASDVGSSVLISSSSNTFENVLPGVTLNIKQAASSSVTVTIGTTDTDLVASVQTFVDNYNKFRAGLSELTAFNVETEQRSILTGDSAALRLDTDLSYLMSGKFAGAGPIRSLAEVGVDFDDDGTLSFDATKLKARYAADPQAVEQFFSTAEFGVSDRLETLIESLAGENGSMVAARLTTIQDKITQYESRIEFMDDRLEAERERMLLDFYRMESAIGKLQGSLAALNGLQPLEPLLTVR
ncbi:MAG: hypothetical protein A2V70_02990 [Planctomycetes bacterium RBG_13_63_9]|nr:MAG: hypothetical protein A2V70_02990 [Planctomycetes bacterium RBG_13_63_9]